MAAAVGGAAGAAGVADGGMLMITAGVAVGAGAVAAVVTVGAGAGAAVVTAGA
jgi:hypothetical protein